MDLGAAAGILRDPWSVAVAPGAPSCTVLNHSFPWWFIQKQNPKLCNANQGVTGGGSFQSVPDPEINVSIGAASGYFGKTTTCKDQGLSALLLLLLGKKSLKQNMLRWVRGVGIKQTPYTGKICPTHPSQPLFLLTNQEQIQTREMIGPEQMSSSLIPS